MLDLNQPASLTLKQCPNHLIFEVVVSREIKPELAFIVNFMMCRSHTNVCHGLDALRLRCIF